jgi:protein gp37
MTKIEWTDEVYNPITGCTPIGEGCKHCYAKRMANRLRGRFGYPEDDPFRVVWHEDKAKLPYKWRKPRRVFVCSMGDLFHADVPRACQKYLTGVWTDCEQHTFQVLTKRPATMRQFFRDVSPPPNVWAGVSVSTQRELDTAIVELGITPARVRWLSVEPMLGHIWLPANTSFLHWVVCGAETGPGKRVMDPGWAKSLRDQCTERGIPFFFKKDSEGSHELDGRVWEQFPEREP